MIGSRFSIITFTLSIMGLAQPAFSQETEPPREEFALTDAEVRAVERTVTTPTGEALFGFVQPQFQIRSSIEGQSARLTFSNPNSDSGLLRDVGTSITFTAPLNKAEGRGDLITQAGLPSAYSVEVGLQIEDFSPQSGREGNSRILSLHGWNVVGALGREAFDYRDPVTLERVDVDEFVFGFAATYVYSPNIQKPISYIAGFEIERDYDPSDSEIRCPADAGGEATVTCFNASFEAPERETDATIFGAVRYTDLGEGLPFGAEFRVALNPENGEWGAELPIYFLTGSDGNLNGGVRLAYDSEEDDVFVGLFIGTTFQ